MRTALLVSLALVAAACATVKPVTFATAAVADEKKLAAAAEAFYRAETPKQLHDAVADAQAAGPETALYHELAANLAQLEGKESEMLQHLLAALRDTGDDAALLHLHVLASLDLTFPERDLVREHLRALAAAHPNPDVRAVAAYHLASLLGTEGALDERDAAIAGIPGQLELAFVGTWDNDQGKGFDLELAPELRPGIDESYEGRAGPLTWRRDAPADPRGRYDLLQLMTPTRWTAAFAQSSFPVEKAGNYALKLMSTDPVKVWVDGKLVFAAPQLERSVYDHLVIPLALKEGNHRVLIKSAHREGLWMLVARVVPYAGEVLPVPNIEMVLGLKVKHLSPESARMWWQLVSWAHLAAGGATTVRVADAFSRLVPKSLVARAWQIDALWFNQERGRTADLLASLDKDAGEELPFVRLRQTRFHLQQNLKQRARDRLLELTKTKPYLREAFDQLADLWRGESWVEDELRVIRERADRFGTSPEDRLELARALQRLGRRKQAVAVYEDLLDVLPHHPEAQRRLADLHLEAGELRAAAKLYERRLASWPVDYSAWLSLAETRRRQGERAAAEAALERAQALSPDASTPFVKRGELAYEAGDVNAAVGLWKRGVELNPENEALANRVDFLAPEARGPWMADIPDEAQLEKTWRAREKLKQVPGADVAYLLDHEVSLLNTDGSTSNVITLVIHAFNAQGRDRIIRQAVSPGRLRVLHAYAVDEKGNRSEASSERNKQIFFRGMQPNSTLVLQYRVDVPPRGFLSRYYTETWSFQGVGDQRTESTFVLWMPVGTQLHESLSDSAAGKNGEPALRRSEEKRGEQVRVTWQATGTPPLTVEPSMPTIGELSMNLKLSTVPDWKVWLSWEQALLEGVFRDSPELDAVAKVLGKGNPDAEEKLKRVHTFVMEEIRYQQDYESFIAGVKPHPASMTLERRYGDCKDKAVLFIELAKKLGLDAHFALVRTRDSGPVEQDVPMQQFNHAIVYVPEQPGVKARFFDPTAELLDVDAVRSDDVGTQSLVFDPKGGQHVWREIPFQAPENNEEKTNIEVSLDAKGGATGTLTLSAVGRAGSMLRRMARNAEVFSQASQRIAALFIPNVTVSSPRALEVEDLRVPAAIRMDVTAGTFARPEGDSLRVKLPSDANPKSTFALSARKYPLLLGYPQVSSMELSMTLPEGWEVRKLPSTQRIELPCLTLAREVKSEGKVVKTSQTYRTTCERISAKDYLQYRAKLDDMVRLLDDELVLAPLPAKGKAPAKPAAGAPR